jgi:addiction module RelE/StbE family toxin
MRIVWSDQSLEDIEEARQYIARDRPAAAESFVDRIFEAADRLIEHPLSGRIVPEFQHPALREVILGSYRIIYFAHPEMIRVSTVFHTARLLKPEHVPEIS